MFGPSIYSISKYYCGEMLTNKLRIELRLKAGDISPSSANTEYMANRAQSGYSLTSEYSEGIFSPSDQRPTSKQGEFIGCRGAGAGTIGDLDNSGITSNLQRKNSYYDKYFLSFW